MKAILIRETGAADMLQWCDVAEPEPRNGQRIIEVRAAGINFVDLLIRQGRYPQAPRLPVIPGREVAGEVDSQRVIALVDMGGYAERVAVDPFWIFPLPDRGTFEEGAAFLLAFLTAYIPLRHQARVGPGDTVLVHAAAGGVGTAAVQVARHLGAHVVATASSEERRQVALNLGADEAYSYEEFADHVRPNVIVDPVGGDVFARSLQTLQPLGAILAVGSAGGWWQDVSPALLVGRNVSIAGFFLGRVMERRPDVVKAAANELLDLWARGTLKPVVGHRLALEDAAVGHQLIEERQQKGKVVLVP